MIPFKKITFNSDTLYIYLYYFDISKRDTFYHDDHTIQYDKI